MSRNRSKRPSIRQWRMLGGNVNGVSKKLKPENGKWNEKTEARSNEQPSISASGHTKLLLRFIYELAVLVRKDLPALIHWQLSGEHESLP